MMKLIKRNKKGFTLMELLIVIIVLGVLAGVAVPVYRSFVQRAQDSEALGFLDATRSSMMRYFAENGEFTTDLNELDFDPNSTQAGQTHAFTYSSPSANTTTFTVQALDGSEVIATADPAGVRIVRK